MLMFNTKFHLYLSSVWRSFFFTINAYDGQLGCVNKYAFPSTVKLICKMWLKMAIVFENRKF